MGLVKCVFCWRPMPGDAPACPACGAPNEHPTQDAPIAPSAPQQIQVVIQQVAAKPERRPPTKAEIAEALGELQQRHALPVAAPAPATPSVAVTQSWPFGRIALGCLAGSMVCAALRWTDLGPFLLLLWLSFTVLWVTATIERTLKRWGLHK